MKWTLGNGDSKYNGMSATDLIQTSALVSGHWCLQYLLRPFMSLLPSARSEGEDDHASSSLQPV